MSSPGYFAIILSICVPLITGTCCFLILGLLALRHHQHYREEMLALRREANERSERFARRYNNYNTFTPRTPPPSLEIHVPSRAVSIIPHYCQEAGVVVVNNPGGPASHRRAASLPVIRVEDLPRRGSRLVPSTLSRPPMNRARRSSDPASTSKRPELPDEDEAGLVESPAEIL